MEENISRFVTAIIAVFLMFIFPVYTAYEKKDDISYALAVRYTQEFVDNVRRKGYITKELYDEYAKKLLVTGNTYNIDMEHEYVRYDGNYVDKTVGSATRNIELFESEHIVTALENEGIYAMNVKDNFNVKITNSNVTLATVIYNILTVNTATNNVRIHVDYGGKILAEKWTADNLKYSEYGGITKNDGYSINLTVNDIDLNKVTDVIVGGDTPVVDINSLYLSNNVKVGDYLAYAPDGVACVDGDSNRYSPLRGMCRKTTDYWQVLSIDRENNKVTLISEGNALSSTYTLSSRNDRGYSVGQNEISKVLFSNSKLGTARNVTREEITAAPTLRNTSITYLLAGTTTKQVTKMDGCYDDYCSCEHPCYKVSITFYEYAGAKDSSSIRSTCVSCSGYNPGELSLRPVVDLNENIIIDTRFENGCGDSNIANCGKKETPWKISLEGSEVKTLGEVAEIGQYVEYIPDKNNETLTISGKDSGYVYSRDSVVYTPDQTFTQNTSSRWVVSKVTDDKITLLSAFSAGGLTLGGFAGINNGIHILNKICRTFYGREDVATARALTYEDLGIEVKLPSASTITELNRYDYYPAIYSSPEYNGANLSLASKFEDKEHTEYMSSDEYDDNVMGAEDEKAKMFISTAFTPGSVYSTNASYSILEAIRLDDVWIADVNAYYDSYHRDFYWNIAKYSGFDGIGAGAWNRWGRYIFNDYAFGTYYFCEDSGGTKYWTNSVVVAVDIDADVLVNTVTSGDGNSIYNPIKLVY